jgi:hypothetical protein
LLTDEACSKSCRAKMLAIFRGQEDGSRGKISRSDLESAMTLAATPNCSENLMSVERSDWRQKELNGHVRHVGVTPAGRVRHGGAEGELE